jgi:hypothetical protein
MKPGCTFSLPAKRSGIMAYCPKCGGPIEKADPGKAYQTLLDVMIADVEDAGFETADLTEYQMQRIAFRMPTESVMEAWHLALQAACEAVGLPKRPKE